MSRSKNPKNKGEDETIQRFGAQICENPLSLEVRSTKTWELVQDKFNPQFYEYFDTKKVFIVMMANKKWARLVMIIK